MEKNIENTVTNNLAVEPVQPIYKSARFHINDIKWRNVCGITLYHSFAFYMTIYYAVPVKWQTVLFAFFTFIMGGFGVTVGAHRLWSHKTFKATLPLKIWTLICYSTAGQNSLLNWVRDHRLHHKHSDSDADPHDARRGLFFSHIGWLMVRKNEEVLKRGREVDLSDIQSDPVLMFHEKYFQWFSMLFCYVVPMVTNVWWLGERWRTVVAWHLMRHLLDLHATFSLNSLAHTFGYQPYNKKIRPTQNRFVAMLTFGEGWHNYHHTFPFDYKGAEFGDALNFSTALIRLCRTLGLAYDLREATPEMVKSVAARLGDGSHSSVLSKHDMD